SRPDLHLGRFRRHMDNDKRAAEGLDLRRFFRGWNPVGCRDLWGLWGPDLHLGGFGSDMDRERRAPVLLVLHCFVGGWNEPRRNGGRRQQSNLYFESIE